MIQTVARGLYSKLQEKYNTRVQNGSRSEIKSFKPESQALANDIFKGIPKEDDCDCGKM
jgi:hypothetical protein